MGPTQQEASFGSSEPGGDGGAFADVYAVLMAGGFGRRLWPLGTDERPKQFLTELAGRSLYVQAAERAARLVGWDHLLVVTNARLAGLVREQTPDLPPANILEEPMRRNTAPAIILAPPGHPTVIAGLTDVIVVHTPAGTLVCHKSAAGRIKSLIDRVLADGPGPE